MVHSITFLESELKSELFHKLNNIKKTKGIRFNDISDLREHIENT